MFKLNLLNNILYEGNSSNILADLEKNSVDLIYLDPPFFTNRKFEILNSKKKKISFSDNWEYDINKYLDFMNGIFNHSFRLLRKTGMLFLHCDYHASHYLKIELDKTFGVRNFRNEIIWKRHNSQNNSKQGSKNFSRIHDTIFVYSKNSDHTWNHLYNDYSKNYIDKTYNRIDEKTGERYALGDLSGPGGSAKGNPYFEFKGFKRYWRYNKEKMNLLFKAGKIIQTNPETVPKIKRYLKNMNGIQMNDIWTDIPNEQTTNKKSIKYPTQKPQKLLDRIIRCSTKEGDIVLDPFCGSGTTLLTSSNLNRNWLGVDQNPESILVTKLRLKQSKINYIYSKRTILKDMISNQLTITNVGG